MDSPQKVLLIDASVAGISGDMLASSLLGLLTEEQRESIIKQVTLAIKEIIGADIGIVVTNKSYQGITGQYLSLTGNDQNIKTEQIKDFYYEIAKLLDLKERFVKIGDIAISVLLEVEKEIHKTPSIHLHELATLDTIIDIILPIIISDTLGIEAIIISPIATGFGTVKTSHGILPVPVPAVDKILQKGDFIAINGPEGEATTPTGIAMLYAFQSQLPSIQSYSIQKSSFGFGSRTWPDRGNFLRVRIGQASSTMSSIVMIETNVDDVEGEYMGYATEKLMDRGALDVSYYPIFMKKNRPAYCIRLLVPENMVDRLADELMKITGSLGLRVQPISRHIGSRSIKEFEQYIDEIGETVNFRVKIGPYRKKIEFEDIRRISEQYNLPIIRVKTMLEKYLEQ